MATWLSAEVVENKQWSADLFSLKISTKNPLQFSAGQFIKAGLKIEDKIIARPYSLVNTPDDSLLEIHFNRVKQGLLSPLLANLKQNDQLKISEHASGLLTLDEAPRVDNLWLFATGTGMGPFLSILKTAAAWRRFKKIILAYSVKDIANQAYLADFNAIQLQHPQQFSFMPFITREKKQGSINERMTNYIINGELEKQVGLSLTADTNHTMLCGNSAMVSDVTAILEARGLRRHTRREPGQIATEKYY